MSIKSTRLALLATVATGLIAASASAQVPQTADEIVTWTSTNNISSQVGGATWSMIGADASGVFMGGVMETRNDANMAKVGERLEFFGPADVGAGTNALSLNQVYDVNCGTREVRLATIAVYAEHNLGSEILSQDAGGEWMPAAQTNVADLVTTACPALRELKSPEELGAWVDANLTSVYDGLNSIVGQRQGASFGRGGSRTLVSQQGMNRWVLFSQLPGAAVLRSLIDAPNSISEDTPRIFARIEWYEPVPTADGQTMRSQMIGYDINCGRQTVRQISNEVFADQNLATSISLNQDVLEYEPAAQHVIWSQMWQDVCVEARPRRNFIDNAN